MKHLLHLWARFVHDVAELADEVLCGPQHVMWPDGTTTNAEWSDDDAYLYEWDCYAWREGDR